MNATDRLDEIEARANAATDGPWRVEDHSHHGDSPSWVLPDIERWRGFANSVHIGEDKATAEFIAHAREDVPQLVAALRAVLDVVGDADEYDAEYAAGEHSYDPAAEERVAVRHAIESALGGA